MQISFVDLQAQYQAIKPEVLAAIPALTDEQLQAVVAAVKNAIPNTSIEGNTFI